MYIIVGCLVICCSSESQNEFYTKSQNRISVNIPYPNIPLIKYDSNTEPFELLLREKYCSDLLDPGMHIEHTILREYYENVALREDTTIVNFSDEEILNMAKELFQPLFPYGKTKLKNKFPEKVNNNHLLSEHLKLDVIQNLKEDLATVEVPKEEYIIYYKRVNKLWKMYKRENY